MKTDLPPHREGQGGDNTSQEHRQGAGRAGAGVVDGRKPRGVPGRWRRRRGAAGTAGKALVGVVVAALASVLAVLGYGFVRQGIDGLGEASALAARGRTADGVVLARTERAGPQGSRTERIEVRFTAGDGREYRFEQGGDAAVGDTVPVHYEAGRPGTASLNSPATGRFLSGMLLCIGLALMVLTPALLVLPARTVLRGALRAVRRRRSPVGRDRRRAARPGRGGQAAARR